METKRYKPRTDGYYWGIIAISNLAVLPVTVVMAVLAPISLAFDVPVLLLLNYLLFSPFFGFVELRSDEVFIKYGLILRKHIPYERVRGVDRQRKFYSDSMLAMKLALEHLNVRYNSFDVASVSIAEPDAFAEELISRCSLPKERYVKELPARAG